MRVLNKITIENGKLKFEGFELLQGNDVVIKRSVSGKIILTPKNPAKPGTYFRLTDKDLSSEKLIEFFQEANAIGCVFSEINGSYFQG